MYVGQDEQVEAVVHVDGPAQRQLARRLELGQLVLVCGGQEVLSVGAVLELTAVDVLQHQVDRAAGPILDVNLVVLGLGHVVLEHGGKHWRSGQISASRRKVIESLW